MAKMAMPSTHPAIAFNDGEVYVAVRRKIAKG
jgi:hypothetical protein